MLRYFQVKLSAQRKVIAAPWLLVTLLLWDTATLSPFLTSISHFAINYWSLEVSRKRATYFENKLNLPPPN